MKKKKGMTFDEKRDKMMTIFSEDKSFFHLKDIEKLGTKKGITYQTIKEVLDSLVGDDMVETEKIGTSLFYWSLPSKVINTKKNKLSNNKHLIKSFNEDNANLKVTIEKQKKLRKETEDYRKKREIFERIQKENEALIKDLNQYELNDPEIYEKYENDNSLFINAFDVLADNLYICDKIIRERGRKLTEVFPDEDYCGLYEVNRVIEIFEEKEVYDEQKEYKEKDSEVTEDI